MRTRLVLKLTPALLATLLALGPTALHSAESTGPKHQRPEAVAALFKALAVGSNDSTADTVTLINLLRGGLDPNVRDAAGRTPLIYAAGQKEPYAALSWLIKSGADLDAQSRDEGATALMEALAQKRPEAALHLLGAGAKADLKDTQGRTAYDIAIAANDPLSLTLTGMLKPLEAGEIVAQAPPAAAAKHNKPEHVVVLIKLITDRKTPANQSRNSAQLLEQLLALGVNPDARDKNGLTPLMLAAAFGDSGALGPLLLNGADINAQSLREGMTPLMGAVFKDQLMVARELFTRGARKDLKDKRGRTAYDIAVKVEGKVLAVFGNDLKAE